MTSSGFFADRALQPANSARAWIRAANRLLLPKPVLSPSLPALTWQQSVAATRQLQRAKNVRDVLKGPFPHTIKTLEDRNAFTTFYISERPEDVTGALSPDGTLTVNEFDYAR